MPTLAFDEPLATFGEAPSQIARREAAALERAKYYQELLKKDNEKWEREREEREEKERNEKASAFLWVLGGIAFGVLYIMSKLKGE
jgi:hypothetical protein